MEEINPGGEIRRAASCPAHCCVARLSCGENRRDGLIKARSRISNRNRGSCWWRAGESSSWHSFSLLFFSFLLKLWAQLFPNQQSRAAHISRHGAPNRLWHLCSALHVYFVLSFFFVCVCVCFFFPRTNCCLTSRLSSGKQSNNIGEMKVISSPPPGGHLAKTARKTQMQNQCTREGDLWFCLTIFVYIFIFCVWRWVANVCFSANWFLSLFAECWEAIKKNRTKGFVSAKAECETQSSGSSERNPYFYDLQIQVSVSHLLFCLVFFL